jgi:hypothetical protein
MMLTNYPSNPAIHHPVEPGQLAARSFDAESRRRGNLDRPARSTCSSAASTAWDPWIPRWSPRSGWR